MLQKGLDPDPYIKYTDPQHWLVDYVFNNLNGLQNHFLNRSDISLPSISEYRVLSILKPAIHVPGILFPFKNYSKNISWVFVLLIESLLFAWADAAEVYLDERGRDEPRGGAADPPAGAPHGPPHQVQTTDAPYQLNFPKG